MPYRKRDILPDDEAIIALAPLTNGRWVLPANRTATDDTHFRVPAGNPGLHPTTPRTKVIR